jgi:hypothetical protein
MSRTPNAPSVNPERGAGNGLNNGQSSSYAQIPGINGPTTPTSFASSTNIIRSHSPNNHPAISIQRAHSSANYGNHYQPSSANLNYSHSTQSPNRNDHMQNRQQIDQGSRNNRLGPDRQYH